MSDELSVDMILYSPGAGGEQRFELKLGKNQMTFSSIGKKAICNVEEGLDPVWSGYRDEIGNPVLGILHDAVIYPPAIFVRTLEYAWDKWKDEELSDEQMCAEIQELSNWVNACTKNRPDTDFWIQYHS